MTRIVSRLRFVDASYWLPLMIVVCASACASAGEPASRPLPSANPFDALVRYVPIDEIESLLLIDATRVPALLDHGAGDPIRSVSAGSRFRMFFEWHGVIVQQFAPCVPADWCTERDGATRVVIGGVDALHVPCRSKENCVDMWVASPATDVLVHATSPELLERAFAGSGGTTAAAAARLGWSSNIDWGAPLLIVRRFDPTNTDDYTSPFRNDPTGHGITGFCGAMSANDSSALQLRVRTTDPADAVLWFGFLWETEVVSERFEHGELTVDLHVAPDTLGLDTLLLFGMNVFI